MARKINITPAQVVAAARKRKPRGRHNHPAFEKQKFISGHSGNPGGKPKVFQTFDAMLRRHLMEPCSPLIVKQLRLKRGATNYDAMIAAQILNAATGDNSSFMNIHNIIEGLLPTKNFNLSVSAEAFLQDPGFREFLKQNHGDYINGQQNRAGTDGALPALPGAEAEEER